MNQLNQTFYARDTITVAQDLLGKYLIHVTNGIELIGKIVEVEAYQGPHDLAAHSCRGRTKRTEIMFGPPGYAYIYLIYGMYHCMNVVTEPEGNGAAVLLRAIEPIKNIAGRTHGPGLLSKAMNIDKRLNAHDLTKAPFYIAAPTEEKPMKIMKRPRIGVDYAGEWAHKLLRFYIKDNPFISKP